MGNQRSGGVSGRGHRGKGSLDVLSVIFVAILILFLWLHFILAQEIETTGREIQVQTEEMAKIERNSYELRHQIAVEGSQERMAQRAWDMGYRPQQPLYLALDQPLAPSTNILAGYNPAFPIVAKEAQTQTTGEAVANRP